MPVCGSNENSLDPPAHVSIALFMWRLSALGFLPGYTIKSVPVIVFSFKS